MRLVAVETVLMMNKRGKAHEWREQPMSHYAVHRAPIIAQHQIELLHVTGKRQIAPPRRTARKKGRAQRKRNRDIRTYRLLHPQLLAANATNAVNSPVPHTTTRKHG